MSDTEAKVELLQFANSRSFDPVLNLDDSSRGLLGIEAEASVYCRSEFANADLSFKLRI